jgi:hypothetical protein
LESNIHVRAIAWPQSGVIKTTDIWPVQIIKKYGVDNLFHGNATDIFSGEKRKPDAVDGGRYGMSDIHFELLGDQKRLAITKIRAGCTLEGIGMSPTANISMDSGHVIYIN